MDKAPKAVILKGEDSGKGSEIHSYSKFLDPSLLCPPRDQILHGCAAAPIACILHRTGRVVHNSNDRLPRKVFYNQDSFSRKDRRGIGARSEWLQ